MIVMVNLITLFKRKQKEIKVCRTGGGGGGDLSARSEALNYATLLADLRIIVCKT
jgi:hypothetical protein